MATTSSPVSQLDVVFDGTWLLVPAVDNSGKIAGVNVYSPACGHPLGVYFAPQLTPIHGRGKAPFTSSTVTVTH
jgi:hypothetical protein